MTARPTPGAIACTSADVREDEFTGTLVRPMRSEYQAEWTYAEALGRYADNLEREYVFGPPSAREQHTTYKGRALSEIVAERDMLYQALSDLCDWCNKRTDTERGHHVVARAALSKVAK